ncbi:MAG: hypothetical protein WCQ50_11220 [Spirochaetota bacterium]
MAKVQQGSGAAAPKNALDKPVTRTPFRKALEAKLSSLTIEQIKSLIGGMGQDTGRQLQKSEWIGQAAIILDFADQNAFDAFFAALPEIGRNLIAAAAWVDYLDLAPFAKAFGKPLIVETKLRDYYNYNKLSLISDAAPGLILPVDDAYAVLHPLAAEVFRNWLPKPDFWTPKPQAEPDGEYYSISDSILDILPLASANLENRDREAIMTKGFARKDARAFAAACGVRGYPIAANYGIVAGELLARFVLTFLPRRKDDQLPAEERLKRAIGHFFDDTQSINWNNAEMGFLFEYRCLFDYLSKKKGFFLYSNSIPAVRRSLLEALAWMRDGFWYSPEACVAALTARGFRTSIVSPESRDEYFKLSCSELSIGDHYYETESYEACIYPVGPLHREIVALPLFRAYFYLMAELGLLEIAELPALERLIKGGPPKPLSSWDGMVAARLTPLGSWCLGFAGSMPERLKDTGVVLVDPELPLLTIQGDSFGKRIFLEQIALKLGPERYRVTEASLISGCDTPAKIEKRIERFRAEIQASPPQLWEELFARVRAKSSVFTKGEPAILFALPTNAGIRALFMADKELRSLVLRVEGGYIVVRENDASRLATLLRSRGFLTTGFAKR